MKVGIKVEIEKERAIDRELEIPHLSLHQSLEKIKEKGEEGETKRDRDKNTYGDR
jgi:hypothetical protein